MGFLGFFKRLLSWPLAETYDNGYTVRVEKSFDDRLYMLTIVNAQNILCGCNHTESLFEMKKMLKEVRFLPPNSLKAMPEFKLDANGRMTQPTKEFIAAVHQAFPETIQKKTAGARSQEDWASAMAAYERRDYATALELSRSLAEQGFPFAQTLRGFMYEEGTGVLQDYAEAMKWFRKAADQDEATAQFKLGSMYDGGHGVPQDYTEAMTWFRKAANQGHAESQNNIGVLYENGHGVPQDYVRAHKWYSLAAAESLGPNHLDVAERLNDLAQLYGAQGQYALAERLCKRALAICERCLGTDHSDVAGYLNNLAMLYAAQDQYAQAEQFYKRSLAIREKAPGPEHPAVATSLTNLAELYAIQGQYAQAEPLYNRALGIADKDIGQNPLELIRILKALAQLYRKTERQVPAMGLEERLATLGAP
jgi:TPR repeat protein